MHDEGLGFNLREECDIGEDICPRRPPAHTRAQAAHSCTSSHQLQISADMYHLLNYLDAMGLWQSVQHGCE